MFVGQFMIFNLLVGGKSSLAMFTWWRTTLKISTNHVFLLPNLKNILIITLQVDETIIIIRFLFQNFIMIRFFLSLILE